MSWLSSVGTGTKVLLPRVDQNNDSNIGSARSSNSLSTLLSTLAPVAIFAAVWFALFLLFRSKFARNYSPRTFLGSLRETERTPKMSSSIFGWLGDFYNIPDTYVLNHHTLDGYLFLRLLKISVVCCLVGCLITWPVLFPVNITGGGGHSQLDMLTFANVTNNYFKYFAHAGCAIIFFTFILWMITRESIFYVNLRQAYLLSPLYASRLSSRTVLFTSVPPDFMNKEKLHRMLGPSVRRIWLATNTKDLDDLVERRDKAAMKLEAAETKLITSANGSRLKAEKKGNRSSSTDAAIADGGESGSLAGRYIKPKQRPTHRLKFLIGQKVDTIDWCRTELQKLIPQIDGEQNKHKIGDATMLNSVFVQFATLSEAQAAYQSLTHHKVLQMAPRFTGMTPGDVIWSNLRIRWWERVIRQFATLAAVVALIVFWSVPVAFVGAISNVNYLIKEIPALGFINDIPQVILGVVTGLLPSILLAVLMALLPIFLRLMAKIGGDPTHSAVELTVQNYYFAFQVIQVFLVATLGSAASSVVQSIIDDPTSVTTLLANHLPLSSNFYLSYFVLQGLGIVSGLLLGLSGLVLFYVMGKFFDKTPRKMWKRWINLSGLGWGTVFPIYTNLFVIAICYAAIAPLVLGFAAIGLYFFYFAYRYNFLFVSNAGIDTKGQVYPRALQQLFVGLYVAEVCLIGLFAIATGTSIGALGPLILMIIMLIVTILYHISLNAALGPLIKYLPKSLDAEERSLLAAEMGVDMEHAQDGTNGMGEKGSVTEHQQPKHAASDLGPAPHKKPNFFVKWLRPDVYTDYATMRRLVPKEIAIEYTPVVEEDAFYNPSITSQAPLLWIPRDPIGISAQEVRDTGKVIPITDEGASVNAKNKIEWDKDGGPPPIYEQGVYY
ncbi:DUF221-domain-containing protein [Rhizodiscina lignyota]|uniref:DUF221-domain-containing protein n=1 Tax=Rhizodiscina lignyota TaxID=1504668 RepID=A0A9P4MA29_9PEZI|nr:DUF221-domain-containing protein [Rhizodiscina lignyota]